MFQSRFTRGGLVELFCYDPAPQNPRPVLLLHGLGADGGSWAMQFPALIDAGFRPIAPDLPGFGNTPAGPGRWSIPTVTEVIFNWINHQQLPPMPVVGISMGGTIALQLILEYPDTANRLVLVNSFACLRPKNLRTLSYLARRTVKTTISGSRSQAEVVANHLFPNPDQVQLRLELIRLINQSDPTVYRNAMRALIFFDVRKRLKNIQIPTLVITGQLDTTVPLENQQELINGIPSAKHVIIPDARHAVIADQAEKFNMVLMDFLNQ